MMNVQLKPAEGPALMDVICEPSPWSLMLFVVPTDLRKHARQLENELDLKLVSFSKLCTSYTTSRDGRRGDS